jgi:N-carbamoyl-L-amino-acid hydrolase
VKPLDQRFEAAWADLTPIGRDTQTGGYRRFAWSGPDADMRAWFCDQAHSRGLTYECDGNGNQWAWWGTPGPGAVVTGSHLDSVPSGGAFDGPLGVVSAFLAIDEMRSRGVQPTHPIAVVNCVDEEGARFGVACIGSQLLTGALSPEKARNLYDADGVTVADAMRAAGCDPNDLGRDNTVLGRIGAFVELHVEQGRGLTTMNAPVGVATSIWPHGRWRFAFRGEANHAGTTLLVDRKDPTLAFAAAVLAARDAAETNGAVATMGKAFITPNGANAIPSEIHAWLDARAGDDTVLERMVRSVEHAAAEAAGQHGTTVDVIRESYSPAVIFEEVLRDRLAEALGGVPVLPTGAGHDAGILSAHVPSAMLFVRNHTGVSHSPNEHADGEDCVAGVEALATVLEDLACS